MATNGVQIIHESNNHWICISTIDCSTNTVRVYNSLKERVSKSLLKQVSLLLDTDCKNVKLIVENTQIQKGGSDCGIFAIASATTLCYGMSPIKCQWDQSLMRNHLKICFEKEKISPFPEK